MIRTSEIRLLPVAGLAGILALLYSLTVQAQPTLQNPGFEESNPAGTDPAGWSPVADPVWSNSSADAHTGTGSVLLSGFHRYVQAVFGIPPRTHAALRIFARVTEPFGRFFLFAAFRSSALDRNYATRSATLMESYAASSLPIAVQPRTAETLFYLQSDSSQNWIWADDAELVLEQVRNGGFETEANGTPADWVAVGAGVWDSSGLNSFSGNGAVRCGAASGWMQDWAALADGQAYVLSFWVRSEDEAVTATTTVEWLAADGTVLEENRLAFVADSGWSPWAYSLSPPETEALALARLRLVLGEEAGGAEIWFDEVRLGWVGVFPNEVSPNGDGLWDRAEVVAWWPSGDGSAPEGLVASMDGETTAALPFSPTADGGGGMWSAFWDGSESQGDPAPEGVYRARVGVDLDDAGTRAEIALEFQLRRGPIYPDEPDVKTFGDPFLAGAWVYLGGPWANSDFDEIFRLLREDGIRIAIAFPLVGRYGDCVEAATRQGVRIILNSWQTTDAIRSDWRNSRFSESQIRSLLETVTSVPDTATTAVIGYYVVDEPFDLLTLSRTSTTLRVLEEMDPGRPGFAAIQSLPGWEDRFQAIRTAVAVFILYPVLAENTDPAAALVEYGNLAESMVREAASAGRDCWIVGQGFSAEDHFEPPGAGEMRALVWIAVAAGARGFAPFLYLSTGSLEGLRGFDLSPRPRLTALTESYNQIKEYNELLNTWRPDPGSEPPPTFGPLLARVWSHSTETGRHLLWVVNLDTESSRSVEVSYGRRGVPVVLRGETVLLGPGVGAPLGIPDGLDVLQIVSTPTPSPPNPLVLELAEAGRLPVPDTLSVSDLSVDATGRFLSVSTLQSNTASRGVRVFDVSSVSTPSLSAYLPAWSAEKAVFSADGSRLAVCDAVRGLSVYSVPIAGGGWAADPLGWWEGVSGNAHDAVEDGAGNWWISAGFQGVRRLAPALDPNPLRSFTETHRIEIGGYGDRLAWVGSCRNPGANDFPPEILAILDEYSGIHLYQIDSEGNPSSIGLIPVLRGNELVSWDGHVAVARQEYGIDVYRVCDPANPFLASRIPALSTVRNLAMAGNRVLVACDGREGLRFFDVADPSNPVEIGRVLPWGPDGAFVDAVAAWREWVAVAGRNRGIAVLDASPLSAWIAGRSWVLY